MDQMDVTELYMTLEVYAHLRDLPQYAALRAEIEKSLKEANDALVPKESAKDEKPTAAQKQTDRVR